MRSLVVPTVVSLSLCILMANRAAADPCGAKCGCRAEKCCATSQCNCCTVMQTCAETVYEEQEQTFYKTEYSEEKVKVKVPAIEYKEEVAYRCCCVTVMQLPPPGSACGPANGCTTGCESPTCPELVPVQVLQKCPYKVMREVNVTKEVEKTQLVCKTVPYKITVCIPHVVYKQVPVQVCCPTVCCKRCATCQPAAPATSACAPAAPSPTGK